MVATRHKMVSEIPWPNLHCQGRETEGNPENIGGYKRVNGAATPFVGGVEGPPGAPSLTDRGNGPYSGDRAACRGQRFPQQPQRGSPPTAYTGNTGNAPLKRTRFLSNLSVMT